MTGQRQSSCSGQPFGENFLIGAPALLPDRFAFLKREGSAGDVAKFAPEESKGIEQHTEIEK